MHSRPLRNGSRLHAPAMLLAAGIAASAISACSGGNPRIDLSNARTTTPVTTVTQTVAVTTTVVTPSPVPSGPTVTVTVLPPSAPVPSYDQARTASAYGTVINAIGALDRMVASGSLTGPDAALQLEALSKHYDALAIDAAPPGMDRPSYVSRVRSLQIFAEAASSEARAGSAQASARYAIIRTETGTLFSMVNSLAKTNFVLPPPLTPSLPGQSPTT